MTRLRWTQVLRSLGLEFWLLLPLLGLGFWFMSGAFTDRVLSRSNETTLYIESARKANKQPPRTIQSITVVTHPQQRTSTVIVKTANSALTTLLFEFPTVERDQIEAAISHELGLPNDRIQALVQYQAESGKKK
ncbi:MAG: hypothetical protein KME27_21525 [Lyngbya sp. HA4199-MV5]|jgi:hypothetical protein|nr:hypothetical protein [Lyngbya sp. HA4199-MV5]